MTELQSHFHSALAEESGEELRPVTWLRDDGRHGGGTRFVAARGGVFNGASVNVSGIHYPDLPDKRLASADAISAIIHPSHAMAPSMHMHISWTQMKDGRGYWRIMADLNPANEIASHKARFEDALRAVAPAQYDEAAKMGERYFYIPALGRTRGVAHYYLEGYNSGNFDADARYARDLGLAAIDTYVALLHDGRRTPLAIDAEANQLAYHTLYLLQVLTLDRGTTSGLLVHSQNDLGIMGSLPARVDVELLRSWVDKMPPPQDRLLRDIVDNLEGPEIDDDVRVALAGALRAHYQNYPQALAMQASGGVIPDTVENHRSGGLL